MVGHVVAVSAGNRGGYPSSCFCCCFVFLFEHLSMLMWVNNHGMCLLKLALCLYQSSGV